MPAPVPASAFGSRLPRAPLLRRKPGWAARRRQPEHAARIGDDDFRAEIVDLVPLLESYARRALVGRNEVSDLVQETCRRALEARSRFIAGSNLRAWVMSILRNLICDRLRRVKREILLGPSVDQLPQAGGDEPPWWAEISHESLNLALSGLPPAYRTTILLFAAEGLSYKAIALRLHIQPTTVGTRLLRARAQLRADLSVHGRGRSRPSVTPRP